MELTTVSHMRKHRKRREFPSDVLELGSQRMNGFVGGVKSSSHKWDRFRVPGCLLQVTQHQKYTPKLRTSSAESDKSKGRRFAFPAAWERVGLPSHRREERRTSVNEIAFVHGSRDVPRALQSNDNGKPISDSHLNPPRKGRGCRRLVQRWSWHYGIPRGIGGVLVSGQLRARVLPALVNKNRMHLPPDRKPFKIDGRVGKMKLATHGPQ